MRNLEIEEILLINWKLVKKKVNTPNCKTTQLTREYLNSRIKDLIIKNNN